MTFTVQQNSGRSVDCANWSEVEQAIDIYTSPNERLSAAALFRSGNRHYAFSYGFSAVHVHRT